MSALRPRPDRGREAAGDRSAAGFTIIEVLVAMVILTTGLLALASTAGYLVLQVQVAELRTKRAVAVQEVMEDLRSTRYSELASRAKDQAEQVGDFTVWWSMEAPSTNLRRVTIYSEGPGYEGRRGWTAVRRDSFSVSLARLD